MIHRISGGLIPETVEDCRDAACSRCVHVAYVQRRRFEGHLLIDTSECMHRKLLGKAKGFDMITACPKLLKMCSRVIAGYRLEIRNKKREKIVLDVLKDEIGGFKHLLSTFGRIWFIDAGRGEFWKLPRIVKDGQTVRAGWLYWALGSTKYAVKE